MKLTINDLFAMHPPGDRDSRLKETYDDGLPFRVSMDIKRLMDDVAKELAIALPERNKMLDKYGKINEDKSAYILPKEGTKKYGELMVEMTELGGHFVEIGYSPIDLDKLAADMGDKIVKGAFISIVDQLNKVHEREEEAKKTPEGKEGDDGADKGESKD